MTPLPKGFVCITGAYVVKAKPVHKVLLTPEQVNDYRNELLSRVEIDATVKAELKKLERKEQ